MTPRTPNYSRATVLGIILGIAIGFSAHIFSGCSGDGQSPVTFTPDFPDPSNLSGGSSSTPPSNPGAQAPESNWPTGFQPGRIYGFTGDSIRVDAINRSGETRNLIFACYYDPTGEIEDQTLIDGWVKTVVPNLKWGKLKQDTPQCHWQCDAVTNRDGPRGTPYYQVSELVAFRTSRQMGLDLPNECPTSPPPPPPPPPPPGCDLEQLRKDANEECEGEFTLDTQACTFTCTPPPPPPPPCEPDGEPPYEYCTWNTQTCSWECLPPPPPPPCPPVGEPECQEQTWDINTCEWVGECPEPGECIYEYGGPPADKEALCLALDDSAFWSDGSQHCVIPLPGISADRWNLTPGQSHPDCLRKQDD